MVLNFKTERTGWRDQELSDRHGLWGFNCPAVDIDFLLLEYDRGKASALVEYKREKAVFSLLHPSYRAIIDLGNRAGVPAFIVRYAGDFIAWRVVPINSDAKRWLPEATTLSEPEYVALLHRIRGHTLPTGIFDQLYFGV